MYFWYSVTVTNAENIQFKVDLGVLQLLLNVQQFNSFLIKQGIIFQIHVTMRIANLSPVHLVLDLESLHLILAL